MLPNLPFPLSPMHAYERAVLYTYTHAYISTEPANGEEEGKRKECEKIGRSPFFFLVRRRRRLTANTTATTRPPRPPPPPHAAKAPFSHSAAEKGFVASFE